MGLVSWILGSENRRNVKKLCAIADKIEALEE